MWHFIQRQKFYFFFFQKINVIVNLLIQTGRETQITHRMQNKQTYSIELANVRATADEYKSDND